MTGIREMFSELSGDDPDWFQMQFWFEEQERKRTEQRNDYRQAKPELVRKTTREAMARRYATDETWRKQKLEKQRSRYRDDPAFAAKHRENMREYARKRHAAKKAAMQQRKAA